MRPTSTRLAQHSVCTVLFLSAAHALHLPYAAPAAASLRVRTMQPIMSISLPGFGGRRNQNQGPSEEMEGRYRLLGISADATYDEIESAYNTLAAKYAGETKRIIKLQVAKDKILEERLRQRMTGQLRSTVRDPFEDVAKKPFLKLPPWLESYAELPTRQDLLRNLAIFGTIGMLPAISRTWAQSSITLALFISIFLLYNRGAPDNSGGMEYEMRPTKVRPFLLTIGIVFMTAALTGVFSIVLAPFLGFFSQEHLISLCVCGGLCLAASSFKVHDE